MPEIAVLFLKNRWEYVFNTNSFNLLEKRVDSINKLISSAMDGANQVFDTGRAIIGLFEEGKPKKDFVDQDITKQNPGLEWGVTLLHMDGEPLNLLKRGLEIAPFVEIKPVHIESSDARLDELELAMAFAHLEVPQMPYIKAQDIVEDKLPGIELSDKVKGLVLANHGAVVWGSPVEVWNFVREVIHKTPLRISMVFSRKGATPNIMWHYAKELNRLQRQVYKKEASIDWIDINKYADSDYIEAIHKVKEVNLFNSISRPYKITSENNKVDALNKVVELFVHQADIDDFLFAFRYSQSLLKTLIQTGLKDELAKAGLSVDDIAPVLEDGLELAEIVRWGSEKGIDN